MRTSFNLPIFEQFDLDSGALTQLCNVVHRFDKTANYQGRVMLGEQRVGTFILKVSNLAAKRPTYIDLHKLHQSRRAVHKDETDITFHLHTGYHAIFHLSSGRGGYSVVVEAAPSVQRMPVDIGESRLKEPDGFDSRKLGEGDFFAVTPLRPGRYEITNKFDGATGRLRVLYPNPREQRDLTDPRLEPARIDCQPGGFHPDTVEVLPAQGLVFQLHADARILIGLKEPDDGPEQFRRVPRPGR